MCILFPLCRGTEGVFADAEADVFVLGIGAIDVARKLGEGVLLMDELPQFGRFVVVAHAHEDGAAKVLAQRVIADEHGVLSAPSAHAQCHGRETGGGTAAGVGTCGQMSVGAAQGAGLAGLAEGAPVDEETPFHEAGGNEVTNEMKSHFS